MLAAPTAAAVALLLCGCVSTQQKAAWAHVENARIIASQRAIVVHRAGREARVLRVAMVREGARLVIAVRLRNVTGHDLNDLPISVGLISGHRRTYLNRAAGIAYFTTHVAVIGARRTVTWVYAAGRRRPIAGGPFALVGPEPRVPPTAARRIPDVRVSRVRATAGRLRVTVTNRSSIPQSPVVVYATSGDRGRLSAAGEATVATLPNGRSATVSLALIGARHHPHLTLEALPTIFQ